VVFTFGLSFQFFFSLQSTALFLNQFDMISLSCFGFTGGPVLDPQAETKTIINET